MYMKIYRSGFHKLIISIVENGLLNKTKRKAALFVVVIPHWREALHQQTTLKYNAVRLYCHVNHFFYQCQIPIGKGFKKQRY